MKREYKKGDKFKVIGLDIFKVLNIKGKLESKIFTVAKTKKEKSLAGGKPIEGKTYQVHTEENSFPFAFFYPHQIKMITK